MEVIYYLKTEKTNEARHTAVHFSDDQIYHRSVVSLVGPDGNGDFIAQNTLYVLCRGGRYADCYMLKSVTGGGFQNLKLKS